MRARSELRGGLRSLVALAVLLGIFGAVAMAAGAGARRTDSAYDRFVAETTPPDAFVASGAPQMRKFLPFVPLRKVLHLPQVVSGAIGPTLSAELLDSRGHVLAPENNLSTNELFDKGPLATSSRVKLLSGRLPDPNSTNQVAIGYNRAFDRRVPVGSSIQMA